MSFPIVFRRIAKVEMDESIAWYENQRDRLGQEFAFEIERTLERIPQRPEQFAHIRGNIRRALLRRFPYGIHFVTETSCCRSGCIPRQAESPPVRGTVTCETT
jgi:hypothetical protein